MVTNDGCVCLPRSARPSRRRSPLSTTTAAADQLFPLGSHPTGTSGAGVFGVASGVGRKPRSSFSEWSYFDMTSTGILWTEPS